jgi:hypothetical protein
MQAKLEAAIIERGLKISHDADNKTWRALGALAAARQTRRRRAGR